MSIVKEKTNIPEVAGEYLTFVLDSEEYGIKILTVIEIIQVLRMTRVPGAEHFVKGVINLRGKVVPVIDLRLKFNVEAKENTEETCIIVINIEINDISITLGMIVDAVNEVANITNENIDKTPTMGNSISTNNILGIGKIDDRVIMLLDLIKTFENDLVKISE